MQNQNSFAIKSNYIITHPSEPLLAGYILIKDGIIHDLISFQDASSDFEKLLELDFPLVDYTDCYIFPGLIDLSVSLNSNFCCADWQDTEATTKMALKGGVTLIFDNPLLDEKEAPTGEKSVSKIIDLSFESSQNALNQRASTLSSSIYTDVGLLHKVTQNNIEELSSVITNELLFGLRIYLAPTPTTSAYHSKKENAYSKHLEILQRVKECLDESHADIALLVSSVLANERDLFMASPCRRETLEKRGDYDHDIKSLSSFGGGHHGNSNNFKNLLKMINDKDDDTDEGNKGYQQFPLKIKLSHEENEQDYFTSLSPNSALLKHISREVATQEEEKLVASLELSEYNQTVDLGFSSEVKPQEKVDIPELIDMNLSCESKENSEDESTNKVVDNYPKSLIKLTSCASFDSEMSTSTITKLSKEESSAQEDISSPLKKSSTLFQRRFTLSSPLKSLSIKNSLSTEGKLNASCSSLWQESEKSPEKPLRSRFSISISQINTCNLREKPNNRANEANYSFYLSNHPLSWENNGLASVLKVFDGMKNGRILFTNLSTSSLAFVIRSARKQKNLKVYSDVGAPFLHFHSKIIKEGCTILKSSPPIREKSDRNLLITSCKKGIFDTVSSFHLQVPEKYKLIGGGSFRRAFSGLCSIGYSLQLTWSKFYILEKIKYKKHKNEAHFKQKLVEGLKKVVHLLSTSPSEIMNISSRKGSIKKGLDADLCVWDPFVKKKIENDDVLIKNKKVFIYNKEKFYGEVKSTYLRGRLAYNFSAQDESNRFLKHGSILLRK